MRDPTGGGPLAVGSRPTGEDGGGGARGAVSSCAEMLGGAVTSTPGVASIGTGGGGGSGTVGPEARGLPTNGFPSRSDAASPCPGSVTTWKGKGDCAPGLNTSSGQGGLRGRAPLASDGADLGRSHSSPKNIPDDISGVAATSAGGIGAGREEGKGRAGGRTSARRTAGRLGRVDGGAGMGAVGAVATPVS